MGKGDFCKGEDTGLDMNDNDTMPTAKYEDEYREEGAFSHTVHMKGDFSPCESCENTTFASQWNLIG
jgi:hypothetical protein